MAKSIEKIESTRCFPPRTRPNEGWHFTAPKNTRRFHRNRRETKFTADFGAVFSFANARPSTSARRSTYPRPLQCIRKVKLKPIPCASNRPSIAYNENPRQQFVKTAARHQWSSDKENTNRHRLYAGYEIYKESGDVNTFRTF